MAAPNLKLESDSAQAVTPTPTKPAVTKKKRWVPQKWESQFDEWIVRSVMGESNLSIAKRSGYTPQHVSSILNTPQAKLTRRQLLTNLQKNLELKTEERLAHLQDRALTRLTQLLDDDKYFEATPLAVADRGIAILRGTGVLKPETTPGNINAKNAVFVGSEHASQLIAGLRMSEEAKKLNSGPPSVAIDVTPAK